MDEYSKCRAVPRYPCSGPAEILHNGSLCWGRLSDISSRGCCIETLYPFPVGSEVQLRLTIAGTVLDICAKAAWIVPQSVMAMSFVNVSAEQENKIDGIINKLKTSNDSPTASQGLPSPPEAVNDQILRDAELLKRITKRINEKGILTKKELMDMVNAKR